MKTLIFTISFIFSISLSAQINTFYKFSESYQPNAQFGHPLTSSFNPSKTLKLSALNNEILHLKVEFAYQKDNIKEGDVLSFTVGNKQFVTYELDLKNGKEYIIENDKKFEFKFVDAYGYPDKGYHSKSFLFRITDDFIQVYQNGELGGVFYLQKQSIDSRNITIKGKAPGNTFVKIDFKSDAYPKLSNFAQNGLRLRASNSLKSKQIATIPYGHEVIVMKEQLNEDNYYQQIVGTKGNIPVENLKSKMIRVLYNGQIGYAYGGYLLPLSNLADEEFDKRTLQFEGWSSDHISFDKVITDQKITFFKTKIDFRNRHWEGLDNTQRIFLIEKLFQNIFNREVIYPNVFKQYDLFHLINNNLGEPSLKEDIADYQYNISSPFDGGALEAVLYFNEGEPVLFEYIERSDKFHPSIKYEKLYVTATKLNLRETLDPKSKIIKKLNFGEDVIITENIERWTTVIGGIKGEMLEVYTKDGGSGFVFDAYLSPIKPLSNLKPLFQKMQPSRDGIEHYCDYFYDERNYCSASSYSPNWMIVYARDVFQIIKSFRKTFPELEQVTFNWNSKKATYDITTSSSKVDIQQNENSWCFLINSKDGYERPMIIIEQLDGLEQWVFKVSIAEEFLGD